MKTRIKEDLSYPWKAFVFDEDYGFQVGVGLSTEPDGRGGIEVYSFKNRTCQYYDSNQLVDRENGLRLNRKQAYALYLGLHNFFAQQKGYSTPESELIGELRATKYHLQDLRSLVLKVRRK